LGSGQTTRSFACASCCSRREASSRVTPPSRARSPRSFQSGSPTSLGIAFATSRCRSLRQLLIRHEQRAPHVFRPCVTRTGGRGARQTLQARGREALLGMSDLLIERELLAELSDADERPGVPAARRRATRERERAHLVAATQHLA